VESFLQLVASGIATGIIYGSLGLAFVIVFQATRTLNLAQGEIAALGTFGAWTLLQLGLPYWLVFVLMIGGSFLGGFIIHRLLIRPLDGKSHFSVIVLTLALLLGINGLDLFVWGGDINQFPTPFGQRPVNFGGVIVNAHDLGTIGVLAIVLVLLYLLMERTSIGLVLRATAQNRVSAELIGIPTDLTVGVGWGLASALGTIAGMLAAPVAFLEPGMMINLLPYALAAITLGGLTSPVGALVGGILVGVFENLVGNYVGFIGQDLKLPVVLLLMAIVLLFRPQGLFGRLEVTRV
jgi:branched-chain amino acid transport system permease protein